MYRNKKKKHVKRVHVKLLFLFICSFVALSLPSRRLNSLIGSLSKHDVDGSENVIGKWNLAFLQSFLNYLKSSCSRRCRGCLSCLI